MCQTPSTRNVWGKNAWGLKKSQSLTPYHTLLPQISYPYPTTPHESGAVARDGRPRGFPRQTSRLITTLLNRQSKCMLVFQAKSVSLQGGVPRSTIWPFSYGSIRVRIAEHVCLRCRLLEGGKQGFKAAATLPFDWLWILDSLPGRPEPLDERDLALSTTLNADIRRYYNRVHVILVAALETSQAPALGRAEETPLTKLSI